MTAEFHLAVLGGPCCRLRAIIGAMSVCDVTDRKLVVHWPVKEDKETWNYEDFPCRMSELWSHPFVETDDMDFEFDNTPNFKKDGDVWAITAMLHYYRPYMTAPARSYIDRLPLVPELQKVADEVRKDLRYPTVGVLLRHWVRPNVPVSYKWIVDRMQVFVDEVPNVQFYVSPDDEVVENILHERFPGKCIGVKLGRNYAWAKESIQRQAIDLELMAACDWFIGSYRSSATQIVAFMRGGKRVDFLGKKRSTLGGYFEDAWQKPITEELHEVFPDKQARRLKRDK
jgi:hypothetical protein